MAAPQVLIPPDIKPVSPMDIGLVDDASVAFEPRFGRGNTQRQLWAAPRWGAKARFEKLSAEDRARLKAAIARAQGRYSTILFSPGIPLRGSFPDDELLTNNDFSGGTTGWGFSAGSVSVADRVLRSTATANAPSGAAPGVSSAATVTQYAPYAVRGFHMAGGTYGISSVDARLGTGAYSANVFYSSPVDASAGKMVLVAGVPLVTSVYAAFGNFNVTNLARQYYDIAWTSLARCILVDNGPNALLQSQDITTSWTNSNSTDSANADTAPDGTSTADRLIEDATAGVAHYASQSVTVTSGMVDFSYSFCAKAGTRNYGYIQMTETAGGTAAYSYFDLTDGTWDTGSTGANWSNLRKHVVDLGDGWYRFTITARKTNAATGIACFIGMASAANTGTYNGDGASYISVWGASLAQSSLPVRYVATTTTATTGTSQTGSALYVKGLPASTSGLLLPGDYIEINGALKRVTASLDSDAAGRGYLQFNPRLVASPSDNDPIIVNTPMGRFMLAGDPRETEHYGVYTDVELDLVEVYE